MVTPGWSTYSALSRPERRLARNALQHRGVPVSDELTSAALAWGRHELTLAVVWGAACFVGGIACLAVGTAANATLGDPSFVVFFPAIGFAANAAKTRHQVGALEARVRSREDGALRHLFD